MEKFGLSARAPAIFRVPATEKILINGDRRVADAFLVVHAQGDQASLLHEQRYDGGGIIHQLEKEKKQFKGNELLGHTLGVVGLGAIGSKVAKTALMLGMEVIGYDPALSVEAAWRLPSEVKRMEHLSALFSKRSL